MPGVECWVLSVKCWVLGAGCWGTRYAAGRGLLRKQMQGIDMAGTKHPEVSMVKRCELMLVQALYNRHYGCVHEANVGIAVALA